MSPRDPYKRKAGRPKPESVPTPEECAREFTEADRRLLTVHHIDGNDQINPADGSNWKNLCIYCHEDEHSRGRLGDYLRGDD